MSFIDEVNAVELGQKAKAKAPLIAAGAVALLLAGGVAAFAAFQPPVTVVSAAQQEDSGATADGAEHGDGSGQEGAEASGSGEGSEGASGGEDSAQGSGLSGNAGTGAPATADTAGDSVLYVHVGGCVAVPGLYRMAPGARLDDAVRAAGGMTGDAASDAVNLAALLEDGQQVIVPSKQQVAEGQWGQGGASSAGSAPREDGSAASGGPLNVNQATAEQLVQLNGIGEALAQRIVADREKNGPFSSVDDLTRVSGIGEKKLEGFRDDVCV